MRKASVNCLEVEESISLIQFFCFIILHQSAFFSANNWHSSSTHNKPELIKSWGMARTFSLLITSLWLHTTLWGLFKTGYAMKTPKLQQTIDNLYNTQSNVPKLRPITSSATLNNDQGGWFSKLLMVRKIEPGKDSHSRLLADSEAVYELQGELRSYKACFVSLMRLGAIYARHFALSHKSRLIIAFPFPPPPAGNLGQSFQMLWPREPCSSWREARFDGCLS